MRCVCGFVVSFILASTVCVAASLQPDKVLESISKQGAQAVVAALWESGSQWNDVMVGVATGSQQWLKVAVALRPGTDAGASEELDEAVFLALKPSAAAVLQLLKSGRFETATVCSSNIGIDYSPEKSRRFIQERIRTLGNVNHTDTKAVRDQCLSQLQAALRDFSSSN
jgi:hypothetical protein